MSTTSFLKARFCGKWAIRTKLCRWPSGPSMKLSLPRINLWPMFFWAAFRKRLTAFRSESISGIGPIAKGPTETVNHPGAQSLSQINQKQQSEDEHQCGSPKLGIGKNDA